MKQWVADEDMKNRASGPSHKEACMLTPASAARTFPDFRSNAIAAATDNSAHAQHSRPLEAPEHASYFDTLMRLRNRRPAPRRAFRRI
jgi:hypothetical protein